MTSRHALRQHVVPDEPRRNRPGPGVASDAVGDTNTTQPQDTDDGQESERP
jgi:hypothetical protein